MTSAPVSVIVTVYNEIASIDALLATLASQSRAPDEVVIVDGGSDDGTLERLRATAAREGQGPAWPAEIRLTVVSAPGANISEGRNLAIRSAQGPWLAVTDAGVRLEPQWLARLLAPIDAGASWVAGFFASDPTTCFETALGAVTLPLASEIDPTRFLPSSRSVAFRRVDALEIGGYPEWLDYCEDLIFDLRLIRAIGRPAFAPQAVAHFRPRTSLAAFGRQYFRYARGDGKADLFAGRHALRYATYLVAIPLLLTTSLAARAPWSWLAGWLLAAGLLAMQWRPLRRLPLQWTRLGPIERLKALALLPMLRIWGDLAKMLGYPVGRLWRRRNRPPAWR
jgi:glycosyltransferase involved in cell wall biosynthesis